MYCRNCSYQIPHLIQTAVGAACPVCRYVYQVSEQKANARQTSDGERIFWTLVGIGAIAIGLKMFFEQKDLSSAVGKLLLS